MSKKIYHVCGGSERNYGDFALVKSQRELIEFNHKRKINWETIEIKQSKEVTLEKVKEINKEGDLLLIGGGGLIMPGDGFQTVSDWQFNISNENLKKIKIPIVVHSIGYNVFPNTFGYPTSRAIASLKLLKEKAVLFSVRNNGSRYQLASHGLDPYSIEVVPDPGIFCSSDPDLLLPINQKLKGSSLLVGLNIAGDRHDQRFKENQLGDMIYKIEKALKAINHDPTILFISHVSKYDSYWGRHLKKSFKVKYYNLEEVCSVMYPESTKYVPQLARIYKEMDIVIGMRGHSCLISFGQGTPCIPIGEHYKTRFFASEIKASPVLNDCENLEKMLKYELFDSDRKIERQKILQSFKMVSDSFIHRIVDLL